MKLGTISKLIHDREYGNIRTDTGEDAHFHNTCLWDIPFSQLFEGQEVEFEMQPSYNGFLAFHIRPHIINFVDDKLGSLS